MLIYQSYEKTKIPNFSNFIFIYIVVSLYSYQWHCISMEFFTSYFNLKPFSCKRNSNCIFCLHFEDIHNSNHNRIQKSLQNAQKNLLFAENFSKPLKINFYYFVAQLIPNWKKNASHHTVLHEMQKKIKLELDASRREFILFSSCRPFQMNNSVLNMYT